MQPQEKAAVAFLVRHLLYGALGGFLFGALILLQDFGHIRSMALASEEPALWFFLLFFGLFITFGSVGMGVGIMSLGKDDH